MQMLLTIQEAADYLRVTARTLHRWRKQGQGPPCHKTGRKWLYDLAEVQTWVKQQPEQPATTIERLIADVERYLNKATKQETT